jgi:hypothetical protein
MQVAIIIIFFPALITRLILFFFLYIFVLLPDRRKIYIIGSLAGFVCGGATAKSGDS